MIHNLRFLAALLRINLKAALALRAAFLMQVGLMIANDLIFIIVWWVLFQHIETIGGWTRSDVVALYGLVAGSFGAAMVLGGGARRLVKTISEGELDLYLTQPKNTLLYVVSSRMISAGWGDIVASIILLYLSGYLQIDRLPQIILAVSCGAATFLSAGVLFGSLAFWLGPVDSLARQLWDSTMMFSVYPQNAYPWPLKLLLFSVVPAGFIGFLPVCLVRGASWQVALALVAGAVMFAAAAVWVFARGVRRYESGNRFGVVA